MYDVIEWGISKTDPFSMKEGCENFNIDILGHTNIIFCLSDIQWKKVQT